MRLFCAHGQNWVWYIIKVDILPFIMVVKILKSDNPKWSYDHLTFEVLKSMKWRNKLSKFAVYHWVNWILNKKSSKLHQLHFKFWSKTFTVYLKHIKKLWFCKNRKIAKNDPHRYFRPYLHLRSRTEASHFDRMDHICEQESHRKLFFFK